MCLLFYINCNPLSLFFWQLPHVHVLTSASQEICWSTEAHIDTRPLHPHESCNMARRSHPHCQSTSGRLIHQTVEFIRRFTDLHAPFGDAETQASVSVGPGTRRNRNIPEKCRCRQPAVKDFYVHN